MCCCKACVAHTNRHCVFAVASEAESVVYEAPAYRRHMPKVVWQVQTPWRKNYGESSGANWSLAETCRTPFCCSVSTFLASGGREIECVVVYVSLYSGCRGTIYVCLSGVIPTHVFFFRCGGETRGFSNWSRGNFTISICCCTVALTAFFASKRQEVEESYFAVFILASRINSNHNSDIVL